MTFRSFLVIVAMAPLAAPALDVSAGAVEVTGGSNLGLSFSSTSASGAATGSTDTTQYGGNVTALYYVISNFGVGLAAGYDRVEGNSPVVKSTFWSYQVGPAVGFVYPLQEKLSLSLQGDAGWLRGHNSSSFSGGGRGPLDGGSSGFAFDLGAGIRHFLSGAFSVNAGLTYTYDRSTSDGPPTAQPGAGQSKLTSSGLRLGVGLSVYFGN
jgi:Outer membrane protein beta-barrel domain